MHILHIAKDEKFIDIAIEEFNKVSWVRNRFLIVSDVKLRYVKHKTEQVSVSQYYKFMNDLSCYSLYNLIVFHSIDIDDRQFLKIIPKNIKILWIGWGFDYVNLLDYSKRMFLSKKTKFLLDKRDFPLRIRVQKLLKQNFLISTIQTLKFKLEVDRVDFFAPVIKEDYVRIKRKWKSFKPTYVAWNYGGFGKAIECIDDDVEKNNILVGNSASPFNNHLDVLDRLADLEVQGAKIICPLSYGDMWYSQQVIARGKSLFDDFHPLVDFAKLDEYYSILNTCSIGVFGHYRQQAAGNITTLLILGAKIFLHEQNPLYQYFTSEGYIIFNIANLDQDSLRGLDKTEIEHNRLLAMRRYKDRNYINRTELLIRKISLFI